MFGDRDVNFDEFKDKIEAKVREKENLNIEASEWEKSILAMSEDEYISQIADNAVSTEIALTHKSSILNTEDCAQIHAIMNNKLDENAGVLTDNRHLQFFDKNGENNMVRGERLKQELKLLDLQTKKMMKAAGNDKEEKIKALCIQVLRQFSIHPRSDGNKRILKTQISHFMEREFKLKVTERPKWKDIPRKVINQAVRGNNIGPFARKICEMYNIEYNHKKITDTEISCYRIYPDTGPKTYTLNRELKRSQIRADGITGKQPPITRIELKQLGIESTLFKKNKVCEDLLNSSGIDSFLRKVKKFHNQGLITESQAKTLVQKGIYMTDGAEDKNCTNATTKFLTTDINDVKKAVRFYEKCDVKIEPVNPNEKVSLSQLVSIQTQPIEGNGIKIR